jgi:hypothetical protein
MEDLSILADLEDSDWKKQVAALEAVSSLASKSSDVRPTH